MDKIKKVQRYFTRRLPGFQNLSYAQRLKELQLDSLELRRIVFDLTGVYKMVMQTSFLCFDTFFEYKLDQRTRGHRFQLRLRRIPRLEICKNFFSYRVVRFWNSLPEGVVDAPSLDIFKKRLKPEMLMAFCRFKYG